MPFAYKIASENLHSDPDQMVYWRNDGEAVITFKKSGNWYQGTSVRVYSKGERRGNCEDLVRKVIFDRGESAIENTSTTKEGVGPRTCCSVYFQTFAKPTGNSVQLGHGPVADQVADPQTGEQLHSSNEPPEVRRESTSSFR